MGLLSFFKNLFSNKDKNVDYLIENVELSDEPRVDFPENNDVSISGSTKFPRKNKKTTLVIEKSEKTNQRKSPRKRRRSSNRKNKENI